MRPDPGTESFPIGVVGAGVMGRGIVQIAAVAGLAVRLHDTREGAAEAARDFVAGMLARAAEKGRMTAADAEAATARISLAGSLDELAGCPVIVEAIVEALEPKRALFAALEGIADGTTILASNTSSLSVTDIASGCARPQRVAGFHFFNPVPLMKLVEVIPGERTDPAVAAWLTALGQRLGHRAVRAADTPGFLVNHAGRGYVTEALRILSEGIAAPADIDRILRDAAGFPMGPFQLLDLTGLDVSHPVMESIYRQFFHEPRFRPVPETARRVAAGLLGRKSGEGFYAYRDGRPVVPEEAPSGAPCPARIWVGGEEADAGLRLAGWLHAGVAGLIVETGDRPSADALCLVTPLGTDATTEAVSGGLDPARTVAVDMLSGLKGRITLMATPATRPEIAEGARALFAAAGLPATVIGDSPGFVVQRVLACIVNIGCEIAQQRIATPGDIDAAVTIGLGYPKGPLALGDSLGAETVHTILQRLHAATGDPRYRPSLWLRRRAMLNLPLATPDRAT